MTGRDLLRQRRFRLLFAARTVSVFGTSFAPVAIAFGVLGLPGADARMLSVVLAAQAVPRLALMLFGGVIGDRFPRYRVLVGAEALSGAAFTVLAVAFLTGVTPLGLLVSCAVLAGTAAALFLPSLSGVVPDVVGPDDLQPANALLKLAADIARVGGLALGGGIVAWLGPGVALAVDAASYLLAAVLLAALRLPASVRSRGGGIWAELRVGWREFTSRRWLWLTIAAAAFINAASSAGFGVLGPVVARDRLGGAFAWSVVLAAYAAGMVGGVVVAMRVRPARPLVAAGLSAVLLGAPLLALGAGAPLVVVAGTALLAGVAFDVFGVLWETTVQQEVPAEVLSRVSAYQHLGAFGLGPVGLAVAGPVALVVGAGPTLLALVAIVTAAALLIAALPATRGLRRPETRVEDDRGRS